MALGECTNLIILGRLWIHTRSRLLEKLLFEVALSHRWPWGVYEPDNFGQTLDPHE